jgi:glycosyltransferase involved in cell wall biosynthesis
MTAPIFSVVVPTYRRPDKLAACLAALACQRLPRDAFEVVVVDDGSGEPPRGVVAEANLNACLIEASHAGPAAARNLGAAKSRGRWLAFTDDDCGPAPEWLAAFSARAETAPDAVLGGYTENALGQNPYATASHDLLHYLYRYFNPDPNCAHLFASNNLCVPRAGFLEVGGFDAAAFRDLAGGEDREFCERWVDRGRRMEYVPEAVVRHAHPLDLQRFWRQHFAYGRGAYRLRVARGRRGAGAVKVEPPNFYLGLLLAGKRASAVETVRLVSLLGLSQVANAAGFFYELRRASLASPARGMAAQSSAAENSPHPT